MILNRLNIEKNFQNISLISASLVFVLIFSIFITLFVSAAPAINEFGLDFIIDSDWNKRAIATDNLHKEKGIFNKNHLEVQRYSIKDINDINADNDKDMMIDVDETNTKTIYGGLVPIVGTILTTLIALIFSLPIAMGIAVFLAEIAPKHISNIVGVAIELLAAIPSIIFGMWGLYYFAPMITKFFGGYQVSLLTAGLVLGVMILPFIASLTRDSMKTTPNVLKESAYALGATKFEVIKDIIFPYSRVGIIGSIILALGRALGETMAVAFLIGSVFVLPSALTKPTISIPVAMANNFGGASGLGESSLFYLTLILFAISFSIISFAKFFFLKRA